MTDSIDISGRKPKQRNLHVVPAFTDNGLGGKVAKPMRMPRISRDLTKASSWLRELGTVYRLMRRGLIEPEIASRLAFIVMNAGKLAASLEELDRRQVTGPGDGPLQISASQLDLSRLSIEQLGQLEEIIKVAGPAPTDAALPALEHVPNRREQIDSDTVLGE